MKDLKTRNKFEFANKEVQNKHATKFPLNVNPRWLYLFVYNVHVLISNSREWILSIVKNNWGNNV
jgi:hypothetical protein